MRPAYALVLLLCAGCGCSEEPVVGEPFEACGPEASEMEERDWIVTSLRWGGVNEGFDLDGEDTQCRSGCIPDGDDGVDSWMGAIGDLIDEYVSEGPCPFFLCNPQSSIDDGSITMLIRVHEGLTSEEMACREAVYHDGVDEDGDPSDNASGDEEILVARGSMLEGGSDLFHDARYSFTSGGEVISTRRWLEADGTIEITLRQPGGERLGLPIQMAHLWVDQRGSTARGMLSGFLLLEDLALLVIPLGDGMSLDPETLMSIYANHADADIVPAGPTDDECTTFHDCPVHWRTCSEDGFCTEIADRIDAISLTLVFEAVPCTITGIAEG